MTEKPQDPEAAKLAELESRKMDRHLVETTIPDSEKLTSMPSAVIAETLTRILSMGNIAEMHLVVGKPLVVKFYEKQTSFGKGKLNSGVSLLSPEAAPKKPQ